MLHLLEESCQNIFKIDYFHCLKPKTKPLSGGGGGELY